MKHVTFKGVFGLTENRLPNFPGLREYNWYQNLATLPAAVNTDVNVRIEDLNSRCSKAIGRAMRNEVPEAHQDSYEIGSNGLVLVSSAVEVDRKAKTVKVANNKNCGVINGLQQYAVALDNAKWFKENGCNQNVKIQLIVGEVDECMDYMVEARNTNTQPEISALMSYRHYFDAAKDVMLRAGLLSHFACKGNEKRKHKLVYGIEDCVIIASVMDTQRYPSNMKHPTVGVDQKSKTLRMHKDSDGERWQALFPLLPDFFMLYERIKKDVPLALPKSVVHDTVGYLNGPNLINPNTGKVKSKNAKPTVYRFPIIDETGTAQLVHMVAAVVLSAFRQFLDFSNGKYEWLIPPDELLMVWNNGKKDVARAIHAMTNQGTEMVSGIFKTNHSGSWSELYDLIGKMEDKPRRRRRKVSTCAEPIAAEKAGDLAGRTKKEIVGTVLRERLKDDPTLEQVNSKSCSELLGISISHGHFSRCRREVLAEAGAI